MLTDGRRTKVISIAHPEHSPGELKSESDCKSRGCKFESQLCNFTLVEIDHEIISTVILPLPLIQEG